MSPSRTCRRHSWTIIPGHVRELTERAGLPDPMWYAGPTADPYCKVCGLKRGDTVEDWRADSARRRARSETFGELFFAFVCVVGAVALFMVAMHA